MRQQVRLTVGVLLAAVSIVLFQTTSSAPAGWSPARRHPHRLDRGAVNYSAIGLLLRWLTMRRTARCSAGCRYHGVPHGMQLNQSRVVATAALPRNSLAGSVESVRLHRARLLESRWQRCSAMEHMHFSFACSSFHFLCFWLTGIRRVPKEFFDFMRRKRSEFFMNMVTSVMACVATTCM